MVTLVLGGARSGKSRFAEQEADRWLAEHPNRERLYLATAQIYDDEMRTKVEQHKIQRGSNWRTIEEPENLTQVLAAEMANDKFILVDCLTLWLSNLLLKEANTDEAIEQLCSLLKGAKGEIVMVSNEVGLGIVPDNKLARQFRDIQGLANQHIAQAAQKVILITAGLPLVLKG
ncbi:MAG: bifunctional adenosylcobinamide kinase/adenosylcobinamide-phosphate guanylyltransferase [Hyphomicrobiales bacterium]